MDPESIPGDSCIVEPLATAGLAAPLFDALPGLAGCGRTHQENSGLIQSARGSPGNDRCEWRVTATHGERIVLNITQLDVHESEHCKHDYLEIRDGYWYRAPLLGKDRLGLARIAETPFPL